MQPVNAYDYQEMYKELGIDFSQLGCIMLDVDANSLPPFTNRDSLYDVQNDSLAIGNPHVTLLFGLLKSGWEYKKYVDLVLKGWNCSQVKIASIGFFDTPKPDEEPYYCIVAHIEITPELQAGHDRLQMLPHVDTFPGYKAHMTIAYIKRDDKIRDDVIDYYSSQIVGKTLKVIGLNYGHKPGETEKSMYCVSCRAKKEPNNLEQVNMKNGRPATKGDCPDCGTKMFRIGEYRKD